MPLIVRLAHSSRRMAMLPHLPRKLLRPGLFWPHLRLLSRSLMILGKRARNLTDCGRLAQDWHRVMARTWRRQFLGSRPHRMVLLLPMPLSQKQTEPCFSMWQKTLKHLPNLLRLRQFVAVPLDSQHKKHLIELHLVSGVYPPASLTTLALWWMVKPPTLTMERQLGKQPTSLPRLKEAKPSQMQLLRMATNF